jgi:hypothetical protein
MKTSKFKLECLLLTVGLCLISINSNSQDTKLSRQERKEAEKAQKYLNFQALDSVLKSKSFVLEADWLENGYGVRRHVMSDINFIMVDSLRAVLQTGSNSVRGWNGVGGVTAEGHLNGLKIVRDEKNMTFFLRFTIVSNIGIYDVAMTVYSNNNARATISGLTMGKLVYDGRIETLYNSRVYKGQNSI